MVDIATDPFTAARPAAIAIDHRGVFPYISNSGDGTLSSIDMNGGRRDSLIGVETYLTRYFSRRKGRAWSLCTQITVISLLRLSMRKRRQRLIIFWLIVVPASTTTRFFTGS